MRPEVEPIDAGTAGWFRRDQLGVHGHLPGVRTAGVIGRSYLERGRPVVVLVQWRTGHGPGGPRNVLIRRVDGLLVVRPFRGLRKSSEPTAPTELSG